MEIIGLEMEVEPITKKRFKQLLKSVKHISEDLFVMHAYYASDNPLETGSTLSSGGLGLTIVKPYLFNHAKNFRKDFTIFTKKNKTKK